MLDAYWKESCSKKMNNPPNNLHAANSAINDLLNAVDQRRGVAGSDRYGGTLPLPEL